MILSWKICGPAGFGIKSAGEIFARTFLKQGYFTFYYSEYPSLIRGGHNTVQIDISEKMVGSSALNIDFLVALDRLTLEMDLRYLKDGGILLYDEEIDKKHIRLPKHNVFALPLTKLARESGGDVMRNSVALGISLAFFENGFEELREAIREVFKVKDGEANIKAAKLGYDYLKKNFKVKKINLPRISDKSLDKNKKLLSGNEAVACGAIAGGLKFFAAYPMTPATTILHTLSAKQKEAQMIVHQGEDETGVIISALGASFAGLRSMVATSGGGFALMTEAISLSGMAEIPIVVIEAMRPAPATGLPTWTDQGDLNFILNAGHGDFPKIVLAPGDLKEAYVLTQRALNLSAKYQLPVIVVSDKFLGESEYSIDLKELKKSDLKIEQGKIISSDIKGDYKRYEDTKDGVSPRAIPGVLGGEYNSNSDEHDERGFSVEGFSDDRKIQMEKRMRKIKTLLKEIPVPELYGPKNADLTIVSWGSNKLPILDAINSIETDHKTKINYLHFNYLYPLPKEKVRKILVSARNLLLIEANQSAQFGKLLRQETGIEIKNKLLKDDGRPFFREEIINKLNNFKFSNKMSFFRWKF